MFLGCSKYGKSLEFASTRRVDPRCSVFEFSITVKITIYQFEPKFTINSRCQEVRYALPCSIYTRGHIEIISSLPTNLPHENAFLCLVHDEKPCINELKSPERYKCKLAFSSKGYSFSKIGLVMFQGPFFIYLDRFLK